MEERRAVAALAPALRERIWVKLDQLAFAAVAEFKRQGVVARYKLSKGGPDNGQDYWWRGQVSKSLRGRYQPNLAVDHHWARLIFEVDEQEVSLVCSIHHVGQPVTGVMNVSFFGEIEQRDVSSKGPKPDKPLTFEKAKSEITFLDLAVEPLSFTKNDLPKAVGDKVAPSLDQAFALALRELGNRLA